jgi:hypothetical protein
VVASPDASRDVLIAYVKAAKRLTREANGAQRSWRFAKVATTGPVVFHSRPASWNWRARRGWRTSRSWPRTMARARDLPCTRSICRDEGGGAAADDDDDERAGRDGLCAAGWPGCGAGGLAHRAGVSEWH